MCRDCNDTGQIQLLTSTTSCDCTDDYADRINVVDAEWFDFCCSCHILPPCGFCLRYAEAGLDEPKYCNICGQPSRLEGPKLCRCV